MELKILGSGSKGNCYLLTASTGERLLIELGVEWPVIQQALNFNYDNLVALVSHSHSDHSRCVARAVNYGIEVSANKDTLGFCSVLEHHRTRVLHDNCVYFEEFYGGFRFQTFALSHDVPNTGFLIYHPECGVVCFITDTKEISKNFEGVNHWLIEANYCEDIIVNNILTATTEEQIRSRTVVSERVVKSHFSYQECEKFLLEQDLEPCENIILLHLSDRNSHAEDFKKRMIRATGKPVYVADKGLTINLDI